MKLKKLLAALLSAAMIVSASAFPVLSEAEENIKITEIAASSNGRNGSNWNNFQTVNFTLNKELDLSAESTDNLISKIQYMTKDGTIVTADGQADKSLKMERA